MLNTAIGASTSIVIPMQFRMSTRSSSLAGLPGNPITYSEMRNRNASRNRYPERRNAALTRSQARAPCRSRLSIRNANVMPVRNRNRAGASPPRNCERTYGPWFRRSFLGEGMKRMPLQHDECRQAARPIDKGSRGAFFLLSAIPNASGGFY